MRVLFTPHFFILPEVISAWPILIESRGEVSIVKTEWGKFSSRNSLHESRYTDDKDKRNKEREKETLVNFFVNRDGDEMEHFLSILRNLHSLGASLCRVIKKRRKEGVGSGRDASENVNQISHLCYLPHHLCFSVFPSLFH